MHNCTASAATVVLDRHYAFAFPYTDQRHATGTGQVRGTSLKLGAFIAEFHDLVSSVVKHDRIIAG
jgi:hypothetical protein